MIIPFQKPICQTIFNFVLCNYAECWISIKHIFVCRITPNKWHGRVVKINCSIFGSQPGAVLNECSYFTVLNNRTTPENTIRVATSLPQKQSLLTKIEGEKRWKPHGSTSPLTYSSWVSVMYLTHVDAGAGVCFRHSSLWLPVVHRAK